MHNQPNPECTHPMGVIGWPKMGKVSRSVGHIADRRSLVKRPGIKHRPNVARNGYAEQSNPFDALQTIGAGNQPHTCTALRLVQCR